MTDSAENPRVYYPALDGLRFVAFSLVYLFHRGVPQLAAGIDSLAEAIGLRGKNRGPSPSSLGQSILDNGWIGVQLFFILSGFLITTLLLREEARNGRIDLKAFWMRRILRIWPLYYFVLAVTFFLIPAIDGSLGRPEIRDLWGKHLVPFLLFAGNWSMAVLGPVSSDAVSVLWSVCVEEQFYLVCPLLIAWLRPSYRIPSVVFLIFLGIGSRALTAYLLGRQIVTPVFFQYSSLTHLDTLLAGVLLALVRERPGGGSFVRKLSAYSALGWLSAFGLMIIPNLGRGGLVARTFGFVAIWAVGASLVAIAAENRGWIARGLQNGRLVWLGRISYGLYMYHEIAFWAKRCLFEQMGWFPNQEALAPFLALGLTIAMAAGSYYALERPFLRRKSRWSRVLSRPV